MRRGVRWALVGVLLSAMAVGTAACKASESHDCPSFNFSGGPTSTTQPSHDNTVCYTVKG